MCRKVATPCWPQSLAVAAANSTGYITDLYNLVTVRKKQQLPGFSLRFARKFDSPLVNTSQIKTDLTNLRAKLENLGSKCIILGLKENPGNC